MTAEQWRSITSEPNYEVSDLGRVRRARPGSSTHAGKILRSSLSHGYPQVTLFHGGVQSTRKIHALVAEAFLGPRPEGQQVRHLNGTRSDPRLVNLAYGPASDNQQDSVAHGTHSEVRKTHCVRGHEFTDANTYHHGGRRHCRSCRRAQRRNHAERKGAL